MLDRQFCWMVWGSSGGCPSPPLMPAMVSLFFQEGHCDLKNIILVSVRAPSLLYHSDHPGVTGPLLVTYTAT